MYILTWLTNSTTVCMASLKLFVLFTSTCANAFLVKKKRGAKKSTEKIYTKLNGRTESQTRKLNLTMEITMTKRRFKHLNKK